MKNLKFLVFFLACFFISAQSFAAVSLSIKNEDIPKTKILFFGFDSTDPNLRIDSFDILERIRRNLKTTDLFEVIKQSGQMEVGKAAPIVTNGKTALKTAPQTQVAPTTSQENLTVESVPNFEKYNKAGIGAIVIGQFNYDQTGNLEVRIRMWDVLDQRQLFGKFYTSSRDNYRKVANIISDEIFKAISGEKIGHFNSQILYVSESGPLTKRVKKINIIDFDGENHRTLSDGRDLVLTPIFSKKRDEIFYLRYFH